MVDVQSAAAWLMQNVDKVMYVCSSSCLFFPLPLTLVGLPPFVFDLLHRAKLDREDRMKVGCFLAC